MNDTAGAVSMSQRIFSMNLPVESVSLYLLCCALADAGTPITIDALQARWNDSEEALHREIASLEKRNILRARDAGGASGSGYRLTADTAWR